MLGKTSLEKTWRDYFTIVILALIVAILVRLFLLTAYKVPTGSMQPALKAGDFIFASRASYGIKIPFVNEKFLSAKPDRGDLVVFSFPNQSDVIYVKRVVATEGDKVQIMQGALYINGVKSQYSEVAKSEVNISENPNPQDFIVLTETNSFYKTEILVSKNNPMSDYGPAIVPPGEFFVLGDNRDASDDSRHWGTVPNTMVYGKVVLIWLSLDFQKRTNFFELPQVRWSRVFKLVH